MKHFTLDERICLQTFLAKNLSLRNIAKLLDKNVSTISREVRRNLDEKGRYLPAKANKFYKERRENSVRKRKLSANTKLFEFVLEGLNKFWSPEIISARWKIAFKDEKLSHVTIYKAIKDNLFFGIEPRSHLRRRGKKKFEKRSKFNTIKPNRLIIDWSAEIQNRVRIGDWEGDTVRGGIGKGGLVTLVDRNSRFLVAKKITGFDSLQTKEAIIQGLSAHVVNSISLDNGSEFALHEQIEEALNTQIYFADPHSPWQRGSNENLNGLLRFFFPKGCNFLELAQENLDCVVEIVNNRPRKCLNWLSPNEYLEKCCT